MYTALPGPNPLMYDILALFLRSPSEYGVTRTFKAIHGLMLSNTVHPNASLGATAPHRVELVGHTGGPLPKDQMGPGRINFLIESRGSGALTVSLVREVELQKLTTAGAMQVIPSKDQAGLADLHGSWGTSRVFANSELIEAFGDANGFVSWLSSCIANSDVKPERRGRFTPCQTCSKQLACLTEEGRRRG